MFIYAPDVQILEYPITFGKGPWATGIGVVGDTFTEPMIFPDGTIIESTDEKFKYTMLIIAK